MASRFPLREIKHLLLIVSSLPLNKCIFISGLNCYSMLKHETLVLTLAAVEKIEQKLLFQMYRADLKEPKYDPKTALEYSQPNSAL